MQRPACLNVALRTLGIGFYSQLSSKYRPVVCKVDTKQ